MASGFIPQFSTWIHTASRHTCKNTKSTIQRPLHDYTRRGLSNLVSTDAQKQTIYALSTPPGKGGVAVVRVSGPDALHVWTRMTRSHNLSRPLPDPKPWKLHRCRIVHPENESLIDDGLAVYFRGMFNIVIFREYVMFK